MKNPRRRGLLPLVILALTTGAMARADAAYVTFYRTEASFLAATQTTLINFEHLVSNNGYKLLDSTSAINGVSFRSMHELGVAGKDAPIAGAPFDSALLFSNYGTPITSDLTRAGTGFTAVGGRFNNLSNSFGTVTLTLLGHSGILAEQTLAASSFRRGQSHSFFGYTVTGDTIVSITCATSTAYPAIDDFRYGYANVVGVPEPSSLALTGLAGLAGLGWAWARSPRARDPRRSTDTIRSCSQV